MTADATRPGSWSQTPSTDPPRSWVWIVVAWAGAAVPMGVQLLRLGYPFWLIRSLALLLLLFVVTAHWFPRRWWLWAGLTFGAALWVREWMPVQPVLMMWVSATVLALALHVLEPPGARRLDRAFVAALPGVVAASLAEVLFTGLVVPVALLTVSGAMAAIAWRRPDIADRTTAEVATRSAPVRRAVAAVNAVVDRIAAAFGAMLGALAMIPSAVLMGFAWLGQRLVRFDSLAPPAPKGSRWTDRRGIDPLPWHLSVGRDRPDPRGGVRWAHRTVATVASLVLIAAAPAAIVRNELAVGACPADEVMAGQPGWPEVGCETAEFARNGVFDAAATYSFADYDGEYVNESDGRRSTWKPPACDCRRVKVWWFGGSAAWGWLQRDEHTVPSQLAKAAWEQGVALDIENMAMPGWVLGQEVRSFADRAAAEGPPDMVVFYDGGNDLNAQKIRAADGRGTDESDFSFAEDDIDHLLRDGPFGFGATAEPRRRRTKVTTTPAEIAGHAMNRYVRGVELARRFAGEVGVVPVFVWQPVASSAPDAASFEFAVNPIDAGVWTEMLSVAVASLPPGVIDLSDSLDDVDRPVFRDLFHTTEPAADIVARELERELRPQLRKLADTLARIPTEGDES